jgi:hypothetical protein
LFLEYDFTVVYKPGKIHGVAEALSRSSHGEPTTGLEDQLVDASLLSIQSITPDWLQDVTIYFQTGTLPKDMPKNEQRKLTLKALPYTLQNGVLYRRYHNLVIRRVLGPS